MLFAENSHSSLSEWPAIIQALGVLFTAIISGIAALYAVMAKKAAEVAQTEAVRTKEMTIEVKGVVGHVKEDIVGFKDDISLVKEKTTKIEQDVQKIEIATNSMKDALVKATGEASFAAGEKSGQALAEVKSQLATEIGKRDNNG